jgi:plasmid stabilization system protein ParE
MINLMVFLWASLALAVMTGLTKPFTGRLQAGPRIEFRLRAGDYRVIFLRLGPLSIEALRVRHRSQAYR